MRRQHDSAFKASVALEAIRGEKTIVQLSGDLGFTPIRSGSGGIELLKLFLAFSPMGPVAARRNETHWRGSFTGKSVNSRSRTTDSKKISAAPLTDLRVLIEPGNGEIAVARQCELLDLSRSSYYYRCCGESGQNLELMQRMDEQYLRTPFYGSPRMTTVLKRIGYPVNHKRVESLMRIMGIVAVYPKKTS